jgi:hypothetical protein
MKVHELMEKLEQVQPEAEVFVRNDNGDVYKNMGVIFDDIGDVEIYQAAE